MDGGPLLADAAARAASFSLKLSFEGSLLHSLKGSSILHTTYLRPEPTDRTSPMHCARVCVRACACACVCAREHACVGARNEGVVGRRQVEQKLEPFPHLE